MIVVADAGPLIHLGAIGHLGLLHRLAPEVLVPEAVYHEVVVVGAGLPGASEVQSAAWLRRVRPERPEVVHALRGGGLHAGEAEAIAVAVERRATWLVIDERQGRLTAASMGVPVVGTLGVVIAAKERGDVTELRPVLEALRGSGMWLAQVTIDRVLQAVGETRS